MEIKPIAYYNGPFGSKFGIPRQSGIIESIEGRIVFENTFRSPDAVRGLEGFEWIWLIWGFSANGQQDVFHATVRPPRLGGNAKVGVFASRSPFRPNGLGLSCVHLSRIDFDCDNAPILHVSGADLMDGTPIYDIKPYLPFADSHPEASAGFIEGSEWETLKVEIPQKIAELFNEEELCVLREALTLDPRPRIQHEEEKIYGFPFAGREIRFKVSADGVLKVIDD